MKVKTIAIDSDVESVLRSAKLDGNNLVIQGQLDRKLYDKFMKVAEKIGFKWNRKLGCHVGEGDSVAKLKEALASGKVVDEKQTYQFFETPPAVADRLVSFAGIKSGDKVLEPSGGKGSIVRAIQRGCPSLMVVHVCELNPQMASDLATLAEASRIAGHGDVVVTCCDFLGHEEKYDKIVMNPPFTAGQDISHVRHAYDLLERGGTLVSVMSPSWRHNSFKKATEFRTWLEGKMFNDMAYVEDIEAGTFSGSGTEVATVIVVVHKPKD